MLPQEQVIMVPTLLAIQSGRKQMQNVTIRFRKLVLSLTQETNNDGRVEVAVLRNGEFVPAYLWSHDPLNTDDVERFVGPSNLATIMMNVEKLDDYETIISEPSPTPYNYTSPSLKAWAANGGEEELNK